MLPLSSYSSVQQNVFTVGYAFKTANRWLSGYFDWNYVWMSQLKSLVYKCPLFLLQVCKSLLWSQRGVAKLNSKVYCWNKQIIYLGQVKWSEVGAVEGSPKVGLVIFVGLHATYNMKLHEAEDTLRDPWPHKIGWDFLLRETPRGGTAGQ